MAWRKTPADRQRDAETYGDPEYRRNRPLAIRRAGGKCELTEAGRRCGSTDRISVDHIRPLSQGGGHHLDNLRVLCRPCHLAKTAREGGGHRSRRGPAADPPVQSRTAW